MSILPHIFAITGLFGLSAGYSYGTQFEKNITVAEKFERVSGNQDYVKQIFGVSDTDNNTYQVHPSLWYWKWYSTETWTNMKPGETYHVKGYGIRHGFLGLYPNIISTSQVDFKPLFVETQE
jgi:hypothetical protein